MKSLLWLMVFSIGSLFSLPFCNAQEAPLSDFEESSPTGISESLTSPVQVENTPDDAYANPQNAPPTFCCDIPEVRGCIRLRSYLFANGGYRFDKVENKTSVLFPNNFEMVNDPLTAKNLQIYQVGARGLFAFDSYWYVKGFYYYGWIVDGDFHDQFARGNLKGNCHDGLGGLGYLIPINRYCSLGYLGGWAYDEQNTVLKDANQNQFNGLKFTSIWNGPWFGLDFYTTYTERFLFNLGYELHLTSWRGSWLLERPLTNAFSDQRKGGFSFGQVVFADFLWYIGCNWALDLELKYQNFSLQSIGFINSSGDAPFSLSEICGPVAATTFVKDATWSSIGVSLNLGYSF